ncbi:Bromodomain and WD repeat-containing protein 3 [Apophysomyces ossiformis]|uniref:Bromodomain and WD repeat-containing protein 3 n=1 Tax=Apophysomyces ossiformis TaxID=679940 RepID=A0A8H7BWM4_9FUNG|nr:Bromodomain and WD repeat-containing protein 3 [Apophysomyces ossiformis]
MYYLIAKFLAASPCKEAAQVLENELQKHRELLPHTMNYAGTQVPMTLERLSNEYPDVKGNYLTELLSKFLQHFKNTADPKILRVSALRHGDESLLTMLSAFIPDKEQQSCNYLTMTQQELADLSLHRMLTARQLGAKVSHLSHTPTFAGTHFRKRVTLSGHRNAVYCLAFDKTNRRLFTGSDDFLVKVWCVRTGYLIHTIRGHQNVITDIAINQENTLIATASSDGYVRVWTMNDFAPVVSLRSNTSTMKPFITVNFSPSPRSETRYLLATNEDGLVRLWKWDKETLQFFDQESPITFSCKFRARDRLRCSSFNYTGTNFAVAGDDGFVYVFSTVKADVDEVNSTQNANSQEEDARPRGGRGRRRVASALFPDKSGHLQAQPVVPIAVLEGHMGSVTDLSYSHDGRRILSGCQDGTARIWSYNKTSKNWNSIILDIKTGTDAPVISPATDLQERKDAIAQLTATHLQPEKTQFGTLMPAPTFARSYDALSAQFSHDTSTPSLTNNQSELPTSESTTPDAVNTHPETQANTDAPKVTMISWSADDKLCIIATSHGDIKVYYACNGQTVCVLKGHRGETYAVECHPTDPNTVLSAGYDGNVILWDLRRKRTICSKSYPDRVFLDCKFSQDVGMKYALTDEDGNCTLFGIGGLDKDYDQVKSWERGQYFYTDYMPLRFSPDGTFLDEQTMRPPHTLPLSPIIDWRGVEYPNQKKLGFGRCIPVHPDTFEAEDARRLASYDAEEEEIKARRAVVLQPIDRARIARRRREFVRNDDEDEMDAVAATQVQFPLPPPQQLLLPDDSNDEDYNEEADGGAYNSSEEESTGDGSESEDYDARDEVSENWNEAGEEGPVTRSRAGQIRRSHSAEDMRSPRRGGRRGGGRGRGRGRGRPGSSRVTRNTRTRGHDARDRSEDEDELPVRPRRRRVTRMSYLESDLDESEPELIDVAEADESQRSESPEAGPSTEAEYVEEESAEEPGPSLIDRKGKRKLRSYIGEDSDKDFKDESSSRPVKQQRVTRESSRVLRNVSKPIKEQPEPAKPVRSVGRPRRQQPRNLTAAEIPQYEPIEWIKCTERTLSKYLPQLGDRIVLLVEGHRQYWDMSEMVSHFDEKHGPVQSNEPVVFGTVTGISWQVGPPTFCRLKLHIQDLVNVRDVLLNQADSVWAPRGRDVTIDYSDEDGCPEFMVLWERFMASMSIFTQLQTGEKVDAVYDDGKYTGTISTRNTNGMYWRRAKLPSPWAYYHVIWDDDESQPEDLSPWELVPSGEDFYGRYDVAPSMSRQESLRAKDTLRWLMSIEDFQLYVQQVNYYDYPNYLSQIAYPICLDMVNERLENGFYRRKEAIIDDVELIRKNAQKYNHESSAANKNAQRMASFFKSRLLIRGARRKAQLEESDDEYREDEGLNEETEEEDCDEPDGREEEDDDDDDEFIDDDDDY